MKNRAIQIMILTRSEKSTSLLIEVIVLFMLLIQFGTHKKEVIMEKLRIHSRSFHRIRNGETHYFGDDHFMGIDPLDHSKFHKVYDLPKEPKTTCKSLMVKPKPITESLVLVE